MWQQLNCSATDSTPTNPSGCDAKLFSWVEVTVGAGTNGLTQPPICVPGKVTAACFTTNYLPSPTVTTGEGSAALGFYNVQQGDVPYFKSLADTYGMSDNFHQSVNGGTGANHIMLGHADAIWFSDGYGHAKVPPHNVEVDKGPANGGDRGRSRKPQSRHRYKQLVHRRRLRRRLLWLSVLRRRLLHRLLGFDAARRCPYRELPPIASASSEAQLRILATTTC